MRSKRAIPLFKVHMPKSAYAPLRRVLSSGFLNEGIQVATFEERLRAFIGNPYTIATNSCTSSITLALKLAGVGPGSEVISSPMTCIATNTPISNLFATPVWCDVDPHTGNIDPHKIEQKITGNTKAILFVDWAGIPADLNAIMKIGKKHGIKVIEDAAHAFGATYKGRNIGTIADFTAFSFQAIKHLTTGDGGALSCRDKRDFARAKCLKWFGIDREATKDSAGNWKGSRWDCVVPEAGFKFHMNNINASLGISQLRTIKGVVATHKRNAAYYMRELAHIPGIQLPQIEHFIDPSWWVFMLFSENRDDLSQALTERGIGNSLLHVRNDLYECFSQSRCHLPGVTSFQARELCIPCGWWVTREDARYIVSCIKEFASKAH